MTLKVRKHFMVFEQRDLLLSGLLYLTFCTLEALFTTTEENEAASLLFCDFEIFSQDQFCLFMEKKGRQILSKIVRASKLTRQRTLQINNAHLNRSCC